MAGRLKVSIEPFIGTSVATGREVRFDQYRIRVNGFHAGLIGFKPGSRVLLSTRYAPLELAEIEKQVAVLLETESVTSSQAPDVPPEMLRSNEEDDDVDDFDA